MKFKQQWVRPYIIWDPTWSLWAAWLGRFCCNDVTWKPSIAEFILNRKLFFFFFFLNTLTRVRFSEVTVHSLQFNAHDLKKTKQNKTKQKTTSTTTTTNGHATTRKKNACDRVWIQLKVGLKLISAKSVFHYFSSLNLFENLNLCTSCIRQIIFSHSCNETSISCGEKWNNPFNSLNGT